MQTHITCPRCQTPFTAEVYQIIDAQRQPQLKQMLLAGALNVGVCPNCGTASQLASPMMYHDSEHELLMVYVPMELNLPLHEQEKIVGQFTKAISDNTPPEDFRAYMLQPQTVLTMQTFMEKVYETEGITPEMLEAQRQKMNLLQEMASADKDTTLQLIEENEELIDEEFFSILQSAIQGAMRAPNGDEQMMHLGNLQARLYTNTEIGKQFEKQQVVMHKFRKEVDKQGGLTRDLFLKYLIENRGEEHILDALIQVGQPAISYELFGLLTAEIDSATQNNEKEKAAELVALRDKLLVLYDAMREQSQQILEEANKVLTNIIEADDKATAVQQNVANINEPLMYLLSAQIAQAEEKGDANQLLMLKEIQNLVVQEAEKQLPPEVRLINDMLRAEDEAQQRALIDQIPAEARPQFLAMLDAVKEEVSASGNEELNGRVEQIQALLAAR